MFEIILFIIGFIIAALIMMNFGYILLIGLIILVICYFVHVYHKSYNGQKHLLEKEIKKYKQQIEQRKKDIENLTAINERLANYKVKPTRVIQSESNHDVLYYDGNNKKLVKLGYEDVVVCSKELLDFELVENAKPIYKYTLGTYFSGKFKTDSKIEKLEVVIYLKNSKNPVVKINCIGGVYDFNKDEQYVFGKRYADEIIACLIDMKDKNKNHEETINLIPEELDMGYIKELEDKIKKLKKESFSKFLAKYYKDKFKKLCKHKWFIVIIIILLSILLIIVGKKIITQINYHNNANFFGKVYVMGKFPDSKNFLIRFNDDSVEYAVKDENGLFYYHSYDAEYTLKEEDKYSKKYKCNINNSYGINLEVSKSTGNMRIYANLYYSELSENEFVLANIQSFDNLTIQNETTCQGKGIFCMKDIDDTISGLYVISSIIDNEEFIKNEDYSIILIDEKEGLGSIYKSNYGFDHVKDVIDDLNYSRYSDKWSYKKYISGNITINDKKITISDEYNSIDLLYNNGSIIVDNGSDKINGTYLKYSN